MKRLLLILLTVPLVSIAMKNQHTPPSNSKELDTIIKSSEKNAADTRQPLDEDTKLRLIQELLLRPEDIEQRKLADQLLTYVKPNIRKQMKNQHLLDETTESLIHKSLFGPGHEGRDMEDQHTPQKYNRVSSEEEDVESFEEDWAFL